jgi:hypothetical protein
MARKKVNTEESVTAFKGFDKDLTCRKFKYEIGETYQHDGSVVRCASGGFHSCEMPLDTWNYYGPADSRFAVVKAAGQIDRAEGEDTKIASATITITAEIKLPELIKSAVNWIVERAKGNTATGNYGHAAATGKHAIAATTGHRGHAATTGHRGHAAATGHRGHAAATGNYGHAATTGNYGHAAATGDSGHAAATGNYGHAAATGNYGHAAATGHRGHAAATGHRGHAAATGHSGLAAATGNYGHAAATGKHAIAASLGYQGTAKAELGGWLVLAYWNTKGELVAVRSVKVGEEGTQPGHTYRLGSDGTFIDVDQ